ncbi:MAG: hypothetical protein Ct9H300mP1_32970 [Planctomycetaceae bacterium]|nr:MAG: hypothetical protein Ct9H300mP1_32970 [Planctomycetaceae bacterium]
MDHRIPKMDRRHDVVGVLPPLGGNQLSVGDRPVDLLNRSWRETRWLRCRRTAPWPPGGPQPAACPPLGSKGIPGAVIRRRRASANRNTDASRTRWPVRMRASPSWLVRGVCLAWGPFSWPRRILPWLPLPPFPSRSVFHLGRLQLRRQVIGNLLGRIGRLFLNPPRLVGLVRLDLGRPFGPFPVSPVGGSVPGVPSRPP